MLQFPPCPYCGSSAFTQGSSTIGGQSYSTAGRCEGCPAIGNLFSERDQAIVLFARTIGPRQVDGLACGRFLSTLSLQWRALFAQRDAEREKAFEEQVSVGVRKEFGMPGYPTDWVPPDEFTHQEIIRRCKDFDSDYQTPPTLQEPVYPARIPEHATVYYLDLLAPTEDLEDLDIPAVRHGGQRVGAWIEVDYAESLVTEVPPDPIVVHADAVYDRVLFAVAGGPVTRTRVPNMYDQSPDPWYAFTIRGVDFVIGRRKRVWSIEASIYGSSTAPGFDTAPLIALAVKRDNTTYQESHDYGMVTPEAPYGARPVTTVLVHAWTEATLIEYMRLLAPETTS